VSTGRSKRIPIRRPLAASHPGRACRCSAAPGGSVRPSACSRSRSGISGCRTAAISSRDR